MYTGPVVKVMKNCRFSVANLQKSHISAPFSVILCSKYAPLPTKRAGVSTSPLYKNYLLNLQLILRPLKLSSSVGGNHYLLFHHYMEHIVHIP